MLTHTGPARCFDSEEQACEAIFAGKINPGDVVVIRYEGPAGGPGMREMLTPTSRHRAAWGLSKSRGAASPTAASPAPLRARAVGHVSPEAAAGGPIALDAGRRPDHRRHRGRRASRCTSTTTSWRPAARPASRRRPSTTMACSPSTPGSFPLQTRERMCHERTQQDQHASTAGQPRGLGSKHPKQGEEMIGAQAVVASLEAEGVDLVFGYPGGQAIKIYDALVRQQAAASCALPSRAGRGARGRRLRARHGQRGRGHRHLAAPAPPTPLPASQRAYMDSVPLVVITGQVPRGVIGTDSFQESDIVGHHHARGQALLPAAVHRRAHVHLPRGVPYRRIRPSRPGADRHPVRYPVRRRWSFNYPDYGRPALVSSPPTAATPSRSSRRSSASSSAERPVLYVGGGVDQLRCRR